MLARLRHMLHSKKVFALSFGTEKSGSVCRRPTAWSCTACDSLDVTAGLREDKHLVSGLQRGLLTGWKLQLQQRMPTAGCPPSCSSSLKPQCSQASTGGAVLHGTAAPATCLTQDHP